MYASVLLNLLSSSYRRTPSGFSLQSEGQGFHDGGASSDTDPEAAANGTKCEDMIARRKKTKRTRVNLMFYLQKL